MFLQSPLLENHFQKKIKHIFAFNFCCSLWFRSFWMVQNNIIAFENLSSYYSSFDFLYCRIWLLVPSLLNTEGSAVFRVPPLLCYFPIHPIHPSFILFQVQACLIIICDLLDDCCLGQGRTQKIFWSWLMSVFSVFHSQTPSQDISFSYDWVWTEGENSLGTSFFFFFSFCVNLESLLISIFAFLHIYV